MAFTVVCISRTVAAGGETVGQAVAQRLGFRYVDEQIIENAAQRAQVDPAVVAAAEHRRPLLQRLIDKLAMAGDLAGPVSLSTGMPLDFFVPPPPAPRPMADDLRFLIRAAIHEVGNAGNVVIVAHAASMALSGTAGVLRVLVTASAEIRAERLASVQGIAPSEAAAAITASDHERQSYFQHFYKIKEELPTHYDLVINTDMLTPQHAVDVILATAQGASHTA